MILAQAPLLRKTWTGRWEATASGRTIGGTWTARDYGDPEECGGQWTLQLEPGKVLLEGTWNARRRRGAWDGAWVAQVLRGGRYQGAWSARIRIPGNLPIHEMFELARKEPVSGTWTESSGKRGVWTIRADPDRPSAGGGNP